MTRTWLIDGRTIARKVRNPTRSYAYKVKEFATNKECPNCHHCIDNIDVSHEWPGLPPGVKFDPSDAELLEHLAAKCGIGNSKPHIFIDEFIQTLEGDEGIYYTHPEKLTGAKKDGSSIHFFHRTVNAYATGQRKRRKVHREYNSSEDHVRWHKTGKTKSVIANGIQVGCKKIMVLYKSSKKGSKPDKSNWVIHQYHLGIDEEEKEGEYVVSKIFYQQQKQAGKNDGNLALDAFDNLTHQTSPRTPNPPNPPRPGKSILCDNDVADNMMQYVQVPETSKELPRVFSPTVRLTDVVDTAWLAHGSQAIQTSEVDCIDDSLLCKEIFDSSPFLNMCTYIDGSMDKMADIPYCDVDDLDNLELGTPPDFELSDLHFGSQDSVFDWIDRL